MSEFETAKAELEAACRARKLLAATLDKAMVEFKAGRRARMKAANEVVNKATRKLASIQRREAVAAAEAKAAG